MLTIYSIPLSLYCAKLRILLRHKELEWQELLPPGGYGSNEYKKRVPSGNLPTLIDGDLELADSESIAEYLNEKFLIPAMLPLNISDRAKCRELSRFHDTRLEPAVRKLFPEISANPRDLQLCQIQAAEINARINQLASMLKPPFSNGLMLSDCGFAITFCWIEALNSLLDLKITWPKLVSNWRIQLEAHSAVSTELTSYRPLLTQWITQNAA
jgi:glutathione S-transferase/maleylpyruvate isomerase